MTPSLRTAGRVLAVSCLTVGALVPFGASGHADGLHTDTKLAGFQVSVVASPLQVMLDDPELQIPRPTGSDVVEADIERWYGIFPRLKERAGQLAGLLSGGEQQMLAMARALMCQPTLLLLDEPSMGLAPIMVEKIFDVIRAISGQGITMLLVEQNARLALQAAHRAYVMESGSITMSGNARDLLDDPRVQAAYLGE
jgi:ABC-type branched-subunit amino acid transport system ATPase component